jgi:hypothetical protein
MRSHFQQPGVQSYNKQRGVRQTNKQKRKEKKKFPLFLSFGDDAFLEAQGVAAPVPLRYSSFQSFQLPELQSRTVFDLASSSTIPHRQEPYRLPYPPPPSRHVLVP